MRVKNTESTAGKEKEIKERQRGWGEEENTEEKSKE